jgi:NAD(P)-dependent dehydrogenase (short-subunit alcohol dehydrogenase family)
MRDLEGKFCLVTGASSGIGRVTAEVLAARGAKVWLACRDEAKAVPVLRGILQAGGNAELLQLDLSDLDSVRVCADKVLQSAEPLHVLINNAGLAGRKALTKQGFELAFGVNHLGHFLLTDLLLPKLLAGPHSRIVNVSSVAHYQARGVDFNVLRDPGKGFGALNAYAVSKLANILHAKQLATLYGARGLHAYSLHPGVIKSDVWREVPQPIRWLMTRRMISNEAGAKTTLYCAINSEVATDNGLYYDECTEKEPSPVALDPNRAGELWEKSRDFVGR